MSKKIVPFHIALLIITTIGGIVSFFLLGRIEEVDNSQNVAPVWVSTKACDLNYKGEVTEGKTVFVKLSCDRMKFTISGTVTQVIESKDVTTPGDEAVELADVLGGTEVVKVDTDYNFDGYNDLSTIVVNGQGRQAIDSYLVFLFNPKTNQFEYAKEFTPIINLGVGEKDTLTSSLGIDYGVHATDYYRWKAGKLIFLFEHYCTEKEIFVEGKELELKTSCVVKTSKHIPELE